MEHILLFFTENFGFFRFFPVWFVFFGLFRNSLFRLFCFYTETESFDVSIEPKQKEDPPKQFEREYILVIFIKFRVVSVCFGLFWNSSVCFSCFDIGSKHRNKPKFFVFGFMKQTETNPKQILFRSVSVWTEIYFCLFRGHFFLCVWSNTAFRRQILVQWDTPELGLQPTVPFNPSGHNFQRVIQSNAAFSSISSAVSTPVRPSG